MSSARVDRVAFIVEDVEATAAQIEDLFGVTITIFDIEIMNNYALQNVSK
jgi:hypothetical protein